MTEMFEGRKIVLSSMVGSWASNLNTPASDKDWKYFVTPTFDDLYTGKMFTDAKVSETLDYDVHDIRQLSNLLWKANLNFIVVLFGYEMDCVGELQWIFDNADSFAVMNLPYFYNATMGMHFEKMSKLLQPTSNTQVLVDKFGYDTKQACHALRCLLVLQRVWCGKNMREALWFDDDNRKMLIDVKSGAYSLDEFKGIVNVWHLVHKENISAWFKSQTANEAMKNMLDEGIKDFIRANL